MRTSRRQQSHQIRTRQNQKCVGQSRNKQVQHSWGQTGKVKRGRLSPRTLSQTDLHHEAPANEPCLLLISVVKQLAFGIPRRRWCENVFNHSAFRLPSERIIGSVMLQAAMIHESKDLQLEDGLLGQLEDKYCSRVTVRRSSSSPDGSQQPVVKRSQRVTPVPVTAGDGEVFTGQNH